MTKILKLLLILYPMASAYSQNMDEFNLCGDRQMYPYYYPELKYEGDFSAITSHFESNYNADIFKNNDNTTGILTVQFQVNCKGETGNYKAKMVDLDYKETEMDEDLVQRFIELTKELDQWIPAKDDNSDLVNSHKFLSFRIVNAEIIEIFPK